MSFYSIDVAKGDIQLYPAGVPADVMQAANNNDCVLHPVNMFMLASLANADPTHRACLDLKTMMTVGLGYEFTNKKAKKSKEFKEFIDTPSLAMFRTFQDILDSWAFDYMTFGNAYLDFITLGKLKAIYNLTARDMYVKPKVIDRRALPGLAGSYHQILRGNSALSVEFKSLMRGDEIIPAQHYVAHILQYDPVSSYYGIPGYLAATPNISENVLIRQHGIRFFSNSARPDMALLISNGDIADDDIKKIQDQLTNFHKGVDNSHRFFVFSIEGENSKVELKEISKTIDGQFLKESEKNRDQIAMLHQVPPKVLGISSAGSLGSGSETIGALKSFVETSINPLQTKFENYINRVLEVMFGFNPEIRFQKIDLTNKKDDALIYTMLSKIIDINGKAVMNTTEIRKELKLPEEPEGDKMPNPDKSVVNSAGKPRVGEKIDQQDKIETVDEEPIENKPN